MELNIGKSIKALRRERDLTQEQLAEIFGVSFQAVSKWETGAAYPDIEMLPGIARYFGVTTDELLGVDVSRSEEMIREIHEEATRLFDARDYAAALPLLRKAVARFPMSEELRYCLAWALCGNCRVNEAYLDEAVCIYEKLLETSKNTILRLKATRNLVYCHYPRDMRKAMYYEAQLPAFAVCREYTVGRSNLLDGQALVDALKSNVDLFAGAILESLEYFEKPNDLIFTQEQAGGLTSELAKEKAELLRRVMIGEIPEGKHHPLPPPMLFSAYE